MGIPSTIVTGTVAYAVLGCVLLGVIFGMQATNTMSKDNAQYVLENILLQEFDSLCKLMLCNAFSHSLSLSLLFFLA